MTKQKILEVLVEVHRKYSDERDSTATSQMCTMWSTTDPPDIIEGTEPFLEIEDQIGHIISDDEALDIYDKTISEAVDYIYSLLESPQ